MSAEGNYIDEDDIDNWADGATEAQKQAVIDYAESLVERVTHDIFYPVDFAIYLDGNGENRVNLNLMPSILSITAVKLSGVALDSSWYTHDKSFVYLDTETATSLAELRYLLKRIDKQVIFPRGIGNVQVIGTIGWPEKLVIDNVSGTFQTGETITGGTSEATAVIKQVRATYLKIGGRSTTNFSNDETITGGTSEATALVNAASGAVNDPPALVKEALVIVCRHDNDSTLYTDYNQGTERLGDYSYSTKDKPLTGIREADLLLRKYVKRKPRVMSV